MPKITYILKSGEEKTIDAPAGLTVMQAARKFGINELEGSCGGSLACAGCHVWVHPDWWEKCLPGSGNIPEQEEDMLDMAFNVSKFSRLSCQIKISDELNGLVVAVPGANLEW
jgi:2Fe-2S ferredoxin